MNRTVKITGLLVIFFLGMSTAFKSDNGKYFEISKNIEIFTNLYKEINTFYVDDLDPGKLMRTGIDAMMESLDPYTNYISESDIEGYRFITEGKYNGIGAISRKIGDYVTITELYKDQPADKAGIKAGDRIVAIDGQDVVGKKSDDINNFLRGFPGTEVELTINRPGTPDNFNVKLIRDEVNVANVPFSGMVSGDVGYIALTTFTRNAGKNVENALKKLKEENPNLKGIIFDLRGNGGGLLTEAVNVCNVFIPKNELVVTTKGKVKDWDRSFKTLNVPLDLDIPLAVLIDKNSASASEIVCGVMQDYDRGVLLGQRSYGKGLVQNTRDVGYNAKVKLTTAKYYIPSKRCIQSVEYENGEPVHIPDEERASFVTRNGRKVLDGGGVKPDVVLNEDTDAAVVQGLLRDNYIFDYVTQYCLKNKEIATVENFEFNDFEGFLKFLDEKNFSYHSNSEKLLDKLKMTSETEGYTISTDIENLKTAIENTKKNEINEYKKVIVDLIEKEIATRFYYQEGKIKMGLKNDEEIKEAVNVLLDQAKYKSILQG